MKLYRLDENANFIPLEIIKLDGVTPVSIPASKVNDYVFELSGLDNGAPGGTIEIPDVTYVVTK